MSFSRYLSKLGQLLNSSGQVLPSGLATGTDFTIAGLTVGKGGGSVSTNTAVGASALAANTTGAYNAAVGYQALNANTTANYGTAVGYQALLANTTGTLNSAFGGQSQVSTTTGTSNSAFGTSSLSNNTSGSYNVAIGNQSLLFNSTASNNTAVGYQAGYSNTTATGLTAIGRQVLYANTTGAYNVAVGSSDQNGNSTLSANSTGSYNTAMGSGALTSTTTGGSSVAIGYQAGYANTVGGADTLIGFRAGYSSNYGAAAGNVMVGANAGYNTTTGNGNVFIGGNGSVQYNGSGYTNTTGSFNTYVGTNSGVLTTTGSKNTILGGFSGNQGGLDIRTNSNYIVLSDGDGNPRMWVNALGYILAGGNTLYVAGSVNSLFHQINTGLADNICNFYNNAATTPYGNYMKFAGAAPNNTTNYFYACDDTVNTKFIVYSNGTVSNRTGTYNALSDIKIKQDVIDATSQWDDIKAIRFRKYRLIDDVAANPNAPYMLGVIAQELEVTSPGLIDNCEDSVRDEAGNLTLTGEITKSVKQSVLLMKAAKALQEAMLRIEQLETRLTAANL